MKSLFMHHALFCVGFGLLLTGVAWFTPADLRWVVLPLVAVCGGTGLAFWLARSVTSAVMQYMRVLEQMRRGEVPTDLALHRQDELGAFGELLMRIANRDKALRQANEDPLTGLANRRYLMQRLQDEFERGHNLSVMFIDLDGFKPINDTYGHDMGDEALKVVAQRFGACVRDTDVLARVGGDEFVILFSQVDQQDVLEQRGAKILELINDPIWIQDQRLKMGASIGIAIAPQDGRNPEELLNSADEAMYAAKQGGKNAFRFYS